MSTILRALQKVEKDSSEDAEQFGPSQPIKPAKTISKRLTALWYLQLGKRFLWIGSGLAVAMLLLYFAVNLYSDKEPENLLSKSSPPQTDEPQAIARHMIPSSQGENQMAAAQRTGPTRPQSFSPNPTYDPNHQPGRYTDKNRRHKIPEETVRTTEPRLETEIISPGNGGEERYDEYNEPEEYEPEETEQPPIEILENDPEELRYAQVALLEGRELELQAISYAQEPSQRISVINNEIMHQGQFIQGYKILYIGPDQVVVEKKGQQWKIIFLVR